MGGFGIAKSWALMVWRRPADAWRLPGILLASALGYCIILFSFSWALPLRMISIARA